MKLHLAGRGARNQVTACGDGYVEINGARHAASLVVLPEKLLTPWPVTRIEELALVHCEAILAAGPQVVLIGTGARITFPPRALLASFMQARVGVEIMDTRAACRTYNILVAEGREVAAALIVA